MNIINAKSDNKVSFSRIKRGEVFRYINTYCMRITDVYIDDYDENDEYIERQINAIDLMTGRCVFHCFRDDELVEPINCELVIK